MRAGRVRSNAAVLTALLAVLASCLPARAAVPSLYLVQNSGWMEPFFTDRASPFKPLVLALVQASQTGRTIVAAFNQDGEVPGRRSPDVAYDGPYAAAAVQAAVNGLGLAARPGGRLADADFNGALVRSLDEVLDGKPGIVWLLTNNKNSRNNSPEIDQNTRAFAEILRSSPYLPFVAAYPVRMPVAGRLYTERGLIIYAIAYGEEAGQELQRVVDSPPMRSLFTDPPVRLKHLDQAPLVFSVLPGPADAAEGSVTASGLAGGGVLLRGVPSGGGVVRIKGTLRSEYYPQTIASADAAVGWGALEGVPDAASLPVEVEPKRLSQLPSGGQREVELVLHLPPVPRPGGIAGLLQQGRVLEGSLRLRLTDMTMSLSPDFTAKMADIAALDQLPDVFNDYQRVTEATASIPVTVAVGLSRTPLLLALGLLVILLFAVLALAAWLGRARTYAIAVDGRTRQVALRPMQSQRIVLPGGRTVVVSGRLFGPPRQRISDGPPPRR